MSDEASAQRRPPSGVVLIARTHWLVGGVILGSFALLHFLLRHLAFVAFTTNTYLLVLGIALLYGATGLLVWTGAPTGRFFSYVCSLIYLARPQLGEPIWRIMRSPEFKAHFARPPRSSGPE